MAETALEAIKLAVNGHNFFITGQAGTGKSTLIRTICKSLQEIGRRFAVTASTGIASAAYADLHGCTIHSWAGLADGRYSNLDLINKLDCDDAYEGVRQRIQQTDVVIIDEISMISARILEQLEMICR